MTVSSVNAQTGASVPVMARHYLYLIDSDRFRGGSHHSLERVELSPPSSHEHLHASTETVYNIYQVWNILFCVIFNIKACCLQSIPESFQKVLKNTFKFPLVPRCL